MDSEVERYIDRSEYELRASVVLMNLSKNKDMKVRLGAFEDDTFYSLVISHAYYAIFYAAKAILLTKGIKTEPPEIHKKTFESFKEIFVDTGTLDVELLNIYKEMLIRADDLLNIFHREKWKRGKFTYKVIAEANLPYAEESIKNAEIFLKNIFAVIKRN